MSAENNTPVKAVGGINGNVSRMWCLEGRVVRCKQPSCFVG